MPRSRHITGLHVDAALLGRVSLNVAQAGHAALQFDCTAGLRQVWNKDAAFRRMSVPAMSWGLSSARSAMSDTKIEWLVAALRDIKALGSIGHLQDVRPGASSPLNLRGKRYVVA